MQTASRSRLRVALRPLAILLIGAVALAVLVGAMQRFGFNEGAIQRYQSYQLTISPASTWHPGQPVILRWVPITQEMSQTPPRTVTCQFWLYGPYATRSLAETFQPQLMPANVPDNDGGITADGTLPVLTAAPLELSSEQGAAAPNPVPLALPATLDPGYYVAVWSVYALTGGGSSWIVQVAAP